MLDLRAALSQCPIAAILRGVKPDEIDDLDSMRLARDVSKKIEESMEYPGQIKVTVVRETRASEYAR